ncbi:hypothetical protein LSH36_8g13030 [Paralvinella palmiformis]|uniref:Uncharacterized protein n=1 Tax=Paralvinella palmiformis TaxID=53620 RepID=A0AAD9KDI1_9ANNE|nr:hypothetical protein LSH36_8g13030 [Paralvinella palmiformis]
MVCKKRRRYRLASIVSYMCTFIGMVFIISNVIMLRRGFVQLYSTTFGDHHSHPGQEYRNPDAYGLRSAARRRPHGRLRHRALPVLDFPRIELPAAALAAELHLRKLMEDESKNGFFRRPISRHDYESVLSKQDARYLRAQEIIAPRPPYGVSFVSVSSRDLRRFLHAYIGLRRSGRHVERVGDRIRMDQTRVQDSIPGRAGRLKNHRPFRS